MLTKSEEAKKLNMIIIFIIFIILIFIISLLSIDINFSLYFSLSLPDIQSKHDCLLHLHNHKMTFPFIYFICTLFKYLSSFFLLITFSPSSIIFSSLVFTHCLPFPPPSPNHQLSPSKHGQDYTLFI